MSEVVLVYSLFGDRSEAERVARAVVEERLAACANILAPCTSIYEWEGELQQGSEIPVLFKTNAEGRDRLMARISALHSYDVPAVLAWKIEAAHMPFVEWIKSTVS